MKPCPFCAESIQDEAKVCRFCNRELPVSASVVSQKTGSSKYIGIAALVGFLFMTFFCIIIAVFSWLQATGKTSSGSGVGNAHRYTDKSDKKLKDDYGLLWSSGVIKKAELDHNFYVSPSMWADLNIDLKKGICYTLADYLESQGKSGWVEIYDYQDGKKLAKLNSWGFETY